MDKKHKYYANTFQVPRVLIDERLKDLDCYEFTILSIIIRKTMGWQKEYDFISLTQFTKIAPKISRRTIINKTRTLEEKGLLVIMRGTGKTINHYKLSTIFFESTGAGDAPVDQSLVQEMHQTGAGDAPVDQSLVQEMHQTGAGDAPISPSTGAGDAPTKLNNIKPTYTKARQPAGGLREVQLFFIEKGIADPLINAWKFFNHYEANGWVQGKNKQLKDWRAAPWASWNFPRSNGKLKVRCINHNKDIEDERVSTRVTINELERDRIVKGLLNGCLKITDNNQSL
jgi:hypothetical protein